MVQIANFTPFPAELFTFADHEGQETRLLVLSATFATTNGGTLVPANPQPEVQAADEYFGDPASSSVRREADVVLYKPFVDVILIGSAYAPGGKPAHSVGVEMQVGDVHKKLRVVGDRRKTRALFGALDIIPVPFLRMPIRYERAYGGIDTRSPDPKNHKAYRPNPVGVGFNGQRCKSQEVDTDAPNIQYPGLEMGAEKMRPAGFGVVSRSWSPRIDLAGTYDSKWLENQWPLAASDCNPRFNQCAPEDQQSRFIVGGEDVRLVNLTPEGEWRFRLPKLVIPVRLIFMDRQVEVAPRLDTIIIEPDVRSVVLSARLTFPVDRSQPPLREVVLGHVTKGCLRAKLRRKVYRDTLGLGGRNLNMANFL